MRCEELLDTLKADSGNPEVEAHVATCGDCRELADLWAGLAALPDPPVPEGLARRFAARLPRRRMPAWMGWAAAALLLAGLGFAAGRGWAGPDGPESLDFAQGSDPQRLQRVTLAAYGPEDNELAGALLDRIARDSSTAVRLAAVEALYLAAPEGDRDGRVEAALRSQDRPEVQVALVDLLVALRQRRAAEALRSLLAEGRLAPSVRRQAERRLADL